MSVWIVCNLAFSVCPGPSCRPGKVTFLDAQLNPPAPEYTNMTENFPDIAPTGARFVAITASVPVARPIALVNRTIIGAVAISPFKAELIPGHNIVTLTLNESPVAFGDRIVLATETCTFDSIQFDTDCTPANITDTTLARIMVEADVYATLSRMDSRVRIKDPDPVVGATYVNCNLPNGDPYYETLSEWFSNYFSPGTCTINRQISTNCSLGIPGPFADHTAVANPNFFYDQFPDLCCTDCVTLTVEGPPPSFDKTTVVNCYKTTGETFWQTLEEWQNTYFTPGTCNVNIAYPITTNCSLGGQGSDHTAVANPDFFYENFPAFCFSCHGSTCGDASSLFPNFCDCDHAVCRKSLPANSSLVALGGDSAAAWHANSTATILFGVDGTDHLLNASLRSLIQAGPSTLVGLEDAQDGSTNLLVYIDFVLVNSTPLGPWNETANVSYIPGCTLLGSACGAATECCNVVDTQYATFTQAPTPSVENVVLTEGDFPPIVELQPQRIKFTGTTGTPTTSPTIAATIQVNSTTPNKMGVKAMGYNRPNGYAEYSNKCTPEECTACMYSSLTQDGLLAQKTPSFLGTYFRAADINDKATLAARGQHWGKDAGDIRCDQGLVNEGIPLGHDPGLRCSANNTVYGIAFDNTTLAYHNRWYIDQINFPGTPLWPSGAKSEFSACCAHHLAKYGTNGYRETTTGTAKPHGNPKGSNASAMNNHAAGRGFSFTTPPIDPTLKDKQSMCYSDGPATRAVGAKPPPPIKPVVCTVNDPNLNNVVPPNTPWKFEHEGAKTTINLTDITFNATKPWNIDSGYFAAGAKIDALKFASSKYSPLPWYAKLPENEPAVAVDYANILSITPAINYTAGHAACSALRDPVYTDHAINIEAAKWTDPPIHRSMVNPVSNGKFTWGSGAEQCADVQIEGTLYSIGKVGNTNNWASAKASVALQCEMQNASIPGTALQLPYADLADIILSKHHPEKQYSLLTPIDWKNPPWAPQPGVELGAHETTIKYIDIAHPECAGVTDAVFNDADADDDNAVPLHLQHPNTKIQHTCVKDSPDGKPVGTLNCMGDQLAPGTLHACPEVGAVIVSRLNLWDSPCKSEHNTGDGCTLSANAWTG
jgi:hypothetical protein